MYAGLCDGIKNEIEAINKGKKGEYSKDLVKIKLDSDENLSLNKSLKFRKMTIIIRSVLTKMLNCIHKFI